MDSRLKAPGINRLKLKSDILLSTYAINFDLRRYNMADLSSEFTKFELAQLRSTQKVLHRMIKLQAEGLHSSTFGLT